MKLQIIMIRRMRSRLLNQKRQRKTMNGYITLHLQEFSAVIVKGATLKGQIFVMHSTVLSLVNGIISDDENDVTEHVMQFNFVYQ